ncbi:MAG: tetratricopeptide repeat protein, partial [Bacteroidota bacterium]
MENYLGQNYEELGRFPEAIAVHRSSLARKREIFVPTHNEIGSSLRNLGKAFQEMGQMDSAWHYLEQAIQAAAMGEPINRRDYALSLFAGADWAYANQQYHKTLSLVAQTQAQLDPQSLLWQMESLEIRSLEFDAYKALGEYEAALEVVDKTDELIAKLIPRLQASESQLRLKQQARALYLQGVEICYQLYQKNKNEALLWRAFRYSEAAKSRVLAIQIHQLRLPNMPPKIARLESKLKTRESYLRRMLGEMERSAKPDPEEVKRLQSALVEVRFEADSLYERIKTDYPDLYALRVRPPSLDHRMLQSQLKADQVFWEYLVGEKRVWAFVIERESIRLYELPDPSVKDRVQAFREAVRKREKAKWVALANQLFDDLVAPILSTAKKDIVLVPDDVLAYLPFEALITEPVSSSAPINQYPYWLRTHEISYAYSALLWTRGRLGASSNGGKLLSVAPAFDAPQFAQTGQRGLGPLLENQG